MLGAGLVGLSLTVFPFLLGALRSGCSPLALTLGGLPRCAAVLKTGCLAGVKAALGGGAAALCLDLGLKGKGGAKQCRSRHGCEFHRFDHLGFGFC